MKPDRFLNIIDVEATCWDGPPPPGQTSEIIEVGVCVLDPTTLERVEKHSIIVKPEHSTVSAFCTELTGWTQADVAGGMSFQAACRHLRKAFQSDSRTWLSWGDYDRKQFERQCNASNTRSPFSARHINAKLEFAQARNGGRKLGMAQALGLLGWPLKGRHHNGADDAWNIAGIVAELLRHHQLNLETF